MATVTVDQQRLVLNSFAAIFQNNLVSQDLVTWNKFAGEMNDRNGLEVVEQVTPDYTTTFTTSAVNDLTAGVQNTTFGSERYKLTQVIGASMGWGDFVKIRDIGEARESQALKKAALRLATDIDAYIIGFAAKASNNLIGDGSSNVSEWSTLASAYTRLKAEGVDDDTNLRAVLTYDDKQALGADIVNNANAGSMTNFDDGVYRKGFSGDVAGIPTLFTQQLPSLTVGTRAATAALSAGTADSATTYESVSSSPAAGQYLTQILNMTLGAAGQTLVDGEVFTIAGVYAWDARAKKQQNYLQQFRVVGGVTAGAVGATAVRVFPALITSGPYRTIAQAPANTAAVTFVGAAGVTLSPRFIADKSAILVHTADLIMPATGKAMRKQLTKMPVSIRMWQDSSFATGEHRIRFDVALEANVAAAARTRLVRITGP